MLNKVILMGRLTRDPEFRQTTSGIPVCRITVAVDRQFANKQTGEREADFIDCDAWRNTAEFISRYFNKGSMIVIEGSLRNNNYTDNNGVKHYSMRVQIDNASFGESKKAAQGGNFGNNNYGGGDFSGGQQGGYAPQGGYGGQQNYGGQQGNFGGGYQNNGYQNAPAPAAAPRPAAPAQDALSIGDIGDFEEILSDGEVPF